MKQLFFLLLFPAFALAQYTGNAGQKITLGEQTTADGLVFRGVANDTNVITPFSDTSAYIILDTVNSKFYHYNRTTTYWSLAGGGGDSGGVTSFSAGTTGLTPSTATTGAVTLGGTLAVANGGTGSATQNFVDLTTAQTVAGDKTFSSGVIKISNSNNKFIVQNTGATTGYAGMLFTNTGGTILFTQANSAGDAWGDGITGIPYSANFGTTTERPLILATNTTGRLIITGDNGRVGIGIASPTEKLHVVGNGLFTGNLGIGSATPTTSGTGITFPATQSASTNVNTLDDYEEGTWTPIYQGLGGSIGSTAYSVQQGRYTKIGRFVHASGEITLTNKGSWSSGVVIEGLPFTTTAAEQAFGFIILGFVDFAADVKYCQFRGTGGGNNRAYIDTIKDNLDREILFTTAINNNSSFEFSFIYTTSN